MHFDNPIILVLAGVVVAAAIWAGARFFSTDAKLERRRRRSNARIVSKSKQPMVKFIVRTKKDLGPGSPGVGSAYGNRTRLSALRGPCPKPIDERANRTFGCYPRGGECQRSSRSRRGQRRISSNVSLTTGQPS